jgi:hypothetical protein
VTDLLDELRDANPVDPTTLELPAGLAARVLDAAAGQSRRARRLRLPSSILAAAAAVCVVVLLLPGGRGGTPDLAARAYAATTGVGIIHWRTEQFSYSNGHETDHQRNEGWTGDGVTHVVRYEVRRGKARLVEDSRTADGRSRIYAAASDDYMTVAAAKGSSADPLAGGDPFAIFRRAYRTGKLTRIGSHRYAVDLPGGDNAGYTATYDIDPATALPERFTLTSSTSNAGRRDDNRLVLRFTIYQRLPLTSGSRAKLSLFAHPGAGPKDDPAAAHFAVLRGRRRPGPAAMRMISVVAGQDRQFGLDANGARAIGRGHYLIPGHGYICLSVLGAKGFGTDCVTVAQAVGHGVSMGTPAVGITVGVPDGVRALRTRERGGRSETVPVRHNRAMLPSSAYAWQFVR